MGRLLYAAGLGYAVAVRRLDGAVIRRTMRLPSDAASHRMSIRTNDATVLPRHRARRRRRHAHALEHAQSAAHDRRPHAARSCLEHGHGRGRRRACGRGRSRPRRCCRGGAGASRRRSRSSCSASGSAPRMRCWRRARRWRRRPTTSLVMFGDTPLIRAETLAAAARRARRRCSGRRARLPPGRSDRLWPAGDGQERACRHPRGRGRQRGRARHRPLQWRPDGARRRACARDSRTDRQRQRQARILSDRRGRDRPRHGAEGGRDRNAGGRSARHQHQGATRRSGSGAAAAPARGGDGGRRHAGRAGDGVPVEPTPTFGHDVIDRAERRVRPRRDGRRTARSIRSFSHLEGAHVGKGARVGPFARLRPGARARRRTSTSAISSRSRRPTIEAGAKANHLAYIGDARVGAGANIGAGTITCNYDGFAKHRTDIGEGAFIGSNSSLVAPVKIGDGAYVGSGSVITKDVPADALALGARRSRSSRKAGPNACGMMRLAQQEGRRGTEEAVEIQRLGHDLAPISRRHAIVISRISRARLKLKRNVERGVHSDVRHCRNSRAPSRSPADLVDALKRLEYRGYDSAGVATLEHGALDAPPRRGQAQATSRAGSTSEPLGGTIGIGHTRWATHGKPTETNAHPHATDSVAVVHNGIIENFRELRESLIKDGAKFASETDTEVVAHLVTREMKQRQDAGRGGRAPRSSGCAAPSRSPSCSAARTTC